VLIVDDNPAIRSEIHQEFNRHGFLCSNAKNRRQAIEQVLEMLPDLIILDLSMPVMNGLDAAPEQKKNPSRLSYHSLYPFCGYPGSIRRMSKLAV
jgi:CheY-like chemotaxis protein